MSVNSETVMGKITSVYGVKGWVKVFSYTQPKENLLKYKVWDLRKNGRDQQVKVLQCKVHGNGMVAHLEGYSDRERSKELADSLIMLDVEALPELDSGEFYWHQLEGLKVLTANGVLLGKVSHLMETGANDVLVIKKCAGSLDAKERLVPYLPEQVVKSVDLESGQLVIDWDPEF